MIGERGGGGRQTDRQTDRCFIFNIQSIAWDISERNIARLKMSTVYINQNKNKHYIVFVISMTIKYRLPQSVSMMISTDQMDPLGVEPLREWVA